MLPIAIRDFLDIEGPITTNTARPVKKLVGVGRIVIGKTNSVEVWMVQMGTAGRHRR